MGNPSLVPIKNLLYFADLSPEAKAKALFEILDSDQFSIEKKIMEMKLAVKTNVNRCVNDRYFIARLVRDIRHLNVVRKDEKKLISYIEANLCMFHSDGAYHPFFISKRS